MTSVPAKPQRYRLLGVHVDAMTIDDMHALIGHAIDARERLTIVSQNLHSVYTIHRDATLRALQQRPDAYVRIDGIPLVWFGRWLGYPLDRRHRTGWMDWMDPFMETAAQRGWRVFYLGSKPGVADAGADRLRNRHPGLHLDVHHGHFPLETGASELDAVLESIRHAQPDVLIVGMGMPRQETFVLHHGDRIGVPVTLTSGAAMDYVAGTIPTPPRWLGPIGLEWLYRLIAEPRRLWRRYLVEPWFAIGLFARDLLRRDRATDDR